VFSEGTKGRTYNPSLGFGFQNPSQPRAGVGAVLLLGQQAGAG